MFTFYNSVHVPISGGYICWDGEKKGFKKIKAFPHVFSYAFPTYLVMFEKQIEILFQNSTPCLAVRISNISRNNWLTPHMVISGVFSDTNNQFSNSLNINWLFNGSILFWHNLPGVSIRSHRLKGSVPYAYLHCRHNPRFPATCISDKLAINRGFPQPLPQLW